MRTSTAVLGLMLAIGFSGCSYRRNEPERDAHAAERDVDSAGNKVGRGAFKASQETGKVLKKAGHELGVVSREIHDGWKDASRESKDKHQRER